MQTEHSDLYGTEYYSFDDQGQKLLVRSERTFRPNPGESSETFRRRVETTANLFRSKGNVEVSENHRAGSLVQMTVYVTFVPPIPNAAPAEGKTGGRPWGPRGRRGGG